jgi:hypothetical protein
MKFAGLLICLLFFGLTLPAQDITGIWRGYFYQGYGIYKQKYKYEIQIDQLNGKRGPGNAKAIKGVTYSYRFTQFYGKANFVGIYNDQTKEITLVEDTLVEVKLEGKDFSCLMTSYLAYQKIGNTEILQGTFSSVVTKKGTDCGGGTVYLERVQESDFHKEDFLVKKKHEENKVKIRPQEPENTTPKKDSAAIAQKSNSAPTNPKQAPATLPQSPKAPQTTVKKPAPKKPSTANTANSKPPRVAPPIKSITDSVVKTTPVAPPVVIAPPNNEVKQQVIPIPDVIKERTNPLVKTIVTNSQDIKIELYDNGEVDGDTITVYHNNKVIAFKKGLTTKAITINIKASPQDAHHEFIMVADNLGTIPPNTALMVVTTGGKRYELFISSDEQHNAKVIIDYKAP